MRFGPVKGGGHSIAPKSASANAANAKVRNRQMIIIGLSFCRLS